MVVNEFEEHISYILEDNDALYSLGLKMIKRLNTDDSIPIVKVVYNNTPKILGSTEELKKLSDIYNELSQAELIKVLIKFLTIYRKDTTKFIQLFLTWNLIIKV